MHEEVLVTIAGRPVDALIRTTNYPRRTVTRYDLPGPGDHAVLTAGEVARTRAVSSRISSVEQAWFLERAQTAPWMPASTQLSEADPGVARGTYEAMTALYQHFREPSRRGVRGAKVSKVLHLKQPGLYPILDSHLLRTYREAAVAQGRMYPQWGSKRLYWAAIRADVLANAEALVRLRDTLARGDEHAQQMGRLSDVRLLDICTW